MRSDPVDEDPLVDPLIPWGTDLHDRFLLPHFVEQVGARGLRVLDHGREEGAGPLDDLVPFRHTDVLDLLDLDRRLARADAVDRLEGRSQDGGLHLVQRGRDEDQALAPPLLALHVDFDASDAAAFLQVAQVELFTQEPFRLAEHGADDVGLLHDPFGLHSGLDHVFSRTWIDVHVPCLPGGGRSRLPFHRSRRCCPAGPFGLLGKEAGKRDPDEWDG